MMSRRSFTTSIVTVMVLGAGAVALEWASAQPGLVSDKTDVQAAANASPSPQSTAPIDLTVNGHHVDVPLNGTTRVTNPDGSQTTVTSSGTSSSPAPSSQPLNVSIAQTSSGGNSQSFSSVTQDSSSFSNHNNHVTTSVSGVTNINVVTP